MKKIEAHLCSSDGLIRPYEVFLCSRCKEKDESMNVSATKEEISEYNRKIKNMKAFEEWKKTMLP